MHQTRSRHFLLHLLTSLILGHHVTLTGIPHSRNARATPHHHHSHIPIIIINVHITPPRVYVHTISLHLCTIASTISIFRLRLLLFCCFSIWDLGTSVAQSILLFVGKCRV